MWHSAFFFKARQNGRRGQGFTGSGLVLQASDGNFYGIQPTDPGCYAGNQHGAVFKLTPSGQFTMLHDVGVCAKGVVDDLIEASDGKLYGVTEGDNVLFSLTKSGAYKIVSTVSGGLYTCTLVQGHDGIIYGTASGGGPTGAGLIFALDAGLPVPRIRWRTSASRHLLWPTSRRRQPRPSQLEMVRRAPAPAGTPASRSAVREIAARARISRSSRAGRSSHLKKLLMIPSRSRQLPLAVMVSGSAPAPGSAGFGRSVSVCPSSLPGIVAAPFHRDHFRAASPQRPLQYRCRDCRG